MLLAPASIGRKLMFAFFAMAGLLIVAVTIGTSGFTFVAKTERKVVNSAIPAMLEAREVAGLSSKITSSVQILANAQSENERRESGQLLFSQLDILLNHIQLLGSDSFDSDLLSELEKNVQSIIDTIAQLGLAVQQKLAMEYELSLLVTEMRQLSVELEELTRTQVRNTSTIAVANITQLYELVEKQESEKVFNALDTLVEVDLDLAERLHELHLLAFQILAHIEEARTVTNFDRIQQISSEFDTNLQIMEKRVRSVEDPTRSEQMSALLAELRKRQRVFTLLNDRFATNQSAQKLKTQTLEEFENLNTTVNLLIDESNEVTANAVSEVTQTLQYAKWTLIILSLAGLLGVSYSIWRIVYLSVVKRLHNYSDALRSIANGKVDFELKVKGKDEIAQMGRAIVTARDTAKQLQIVAESEATAKRELEQHKAQLEDTVEERTRQLRKTNKKLNEEVEQHAKARTEAEQANRAKSAFLSTMSHEIRTPMNGVLGTASLLKSTRLDTQQSHYVDVINRSGTNLLAILNDVLDYSKIEAGHLEIRYAPFNVSELVNDIFQLLESRANEKGLGFHKQIEQDALGYWLGDATRIGQVLSNLLGNAIKFTSSGDIDLYICPDPEREGHMLYEVSDTGIGISEQDMGKLFNVFSQLGTEEAKVGGTGLGLAISQKIVEAFGGVIGVESEPEQGSRFWFSIPLQQSEKPADEISEKVPDKNYKARILMVEDNQVNCLVAEGFLSLDGHEVVIAEDGASARERFAQGKFDIALLDINLPDCNGVELLQQLKGIEAEKQQETIPFVAVSAHVFNEEVENYLNAGFNAYIPKPLDKERLKNTLQACLEGRELILEQLPESQAENAETMVDISVLTADREVLGEKKIRELLTLFIESSAVILQGLDAASEQEDNAEVKKLAHKLKGSAASMGMTQVFRICLATESAEHPLEQYRETEAELKSVLSESVEVLKEEFNWISLD
ncbi:TMAO reductase system sensor histidine kinase/response regulator TorS [Vibrio sp. JC009]|uniref:TMAO reductase system sensor histidine kinase/response regulator TorS n=1 Tax=Vibrio sp. JC009 TaxID=2912314 RepID=UPI0023AFE56B|nr:TMAO reductase system sensor histidine kinase/response regulator TorS [Vibrio sp. JC009]WED24231.1 TMAO reductase system sensor histidine kinase/response regulator TorS [Vibrio sp. JC009]